MLGIAGPEVSRGNLQSGENRARDRDGLGELAHLGAKSGEIVGAGRSPQHALCELGRQHVVVEQGEKRVVDVAREALDVNETRTAVHGKNPRRRPAVRVGLRLGVGQLTRVTGGTGDAGVDAVAKSGGPIVDRQADGKTLRIGRGLVRRNEPVVGRELVDESGAGSRPDREG